MNLTVPRCTIMIAGSALFLVANLSFGDDRIVVTSDEDVSVGIHPEAFEDLNDYRSGSEQRVATYHLGRPATEEEIVAWDIDIPPDGQGLPDGSGNAKQGAALYASKCAACHGQNGEGIPPNGALVSDGSNGKTIGSFWPYATTVFDYIRRAMPFGSAGTLTNEELYAITAFLLFKNGIIAEEAMLDASSLPEIEMPNAERFVPDDREAFNVVH